MKKMFILLAILMLGSCQNESYGPYGSPDSYQRDCLERDRGNRAECFIATMGYTFHYMWE